jgi:transposase
LLEIPENNSTGTLGGQEDSLEGIAPADWGMCNDPLLDRTLRNVPADRAAENVRSFPTFTQDLYALADWLKQCRVKTVAMESTGVYWIPLFQILESGGFEVCLVNARHVKNVPGRRTDVSDCQWLQFLHSVGLLKASYRPEQEVCAVRSRCAIVKAWCKWRQPT